MTYIFLILLFEFTFYFSAGQFLGCPSFWKKHGTSCWLFVQKMVPADVARKTCQQYGGYLATVNSQDEQNFMNANIPKRLFFIYFF